MKKDYLFVSYSSKDKVFVDQVVAKLRSQDVNIWIDDELMKHVGEEWIEIVKDKVGSKYCKGILFFISKTSVSSPQVLKELQYAKSKEVKAAHRGHDLRILPIESVQNIGQIDEWLYDLRDEKEDEREINPRWKEEQLVIDSIRELCFPDNNTLRIPLSFDVDEMISHLVETLQKEFPSVFQHQEMEKSISYGKKVLFQYERICGSVISQDLKLLRYKPVSLLLESGEKTQYPQCIELEFHDGKCVIGRKNPFGEDLADYCFDAKFAFISRKHLCIEQQKGQVFITDLGSINGTYLNDVRLQPMVPYPLNNGAVIMISWDNQLKYRVSM